jgi:gliding motility-associated-like protein
LKQALHIILLILLSLSVSGSTAAQDTVVCAGDHGMYATSSTYSFNSIYQWDVEGGEMIQDYGNRIEVEWDDNTEEGRITVTEVGLNGCEGVKKEYVVDIHSTFADLGMNREICEGDSIRFTPGSGYDNYRWHNGSSQSYYMADSSGTYWVQVSDQYGCVDRDTVQLTVHDNPEVNIEASTSYPGKVYIDQDSVAFAAGEVDYITLDAGMWSSYEWNTGDMMSSIDVEDTDVARATSGTKSKDFWVTVANEYGCQSTDSIAVTVMGGLEIPNAFTPNNDQANNLWKIPGLSLYPNCVVKVFDRWGKLVFQSRGYDEANYWDGTDRNGKELPMDSYYYIIRLGDDQKPIQGTISIIR